MKITLKVFLDIYSIHEVEEAIDATLNQLNVDSIEQLIVAFPHPGDDEIDHVWLDKVLTIWNELEKLVQSGKLISIGVSDFDLEALQMLVDKAETKPCVNHYNIDGCCVVSIYIICELYYFLLYFRYLQIFRNMLKRTIFNY